MSKKIPIAEMFVSPQGEGAYAGTLMQFVRTAGCSVGKKLNAMDQRKFGHEPLCKNCSALESSHSDSLHWCRSFVPAEDPHPLPVYIEKCTTWDGREFLCDTDFRTKEALAPEEIMARMPKDVAHICLTGGEPLNHNLEELCHLVYEADKFLHIETSGTVSILDALPSFVLSQQMGNSVSGFIWITVSPKLGCLPGMLELANEVKMLVDDGFDETKVPESLLHPIGSYPEQLIFISAVNGEHTLDCVNMERCLALQLKHPHWRLALQSHKVWGVR